MAFYSLTKEQRAKLVAQIKSDIVLGIRKKQLSNVIPHFSDEDTYIRKSAYLAAGKIYVEHPDLQEKILSMLEKFMEEKEAYKLYFDEAYKYTNWDVGCDVLFELREIRK